MILEGTASIHIKKRLEEIEKDINLIRDTAEKNINFYDIKNL